MNISKTKKLTTISMLCALAYAAAAVGRIPLVLFLKYDPKDVIIAIGGLLFGPITGKYVLYRGESQAVGEIQYQNVEEYLKNLKGD